jgi:hypothetical protein
MGQGDTWDNKEEFQRKNHLLALLQFLGKGLQCSQSIASSCETTLFKPTFAGLLCEGGWLALLSCQMFGTQSPSVLKGAQGFREQARIHMKANESEWAIAQILTLPSKPAGPVSWAQTA